MKRKKRSRSIKKNKDINISKHYDNSSKHVMSDPTDKISFLTQKPITKKEEEEEGKTITKNFDTSRYEPITEMKESIATSTSIHEQDENKKKTLSTAQKEGLVNAEMVISTIPSGSNNNNDDDDETYANFPTTTPAIIKEQTSNTTEPKQPKEKEEESGPKEYKNIKNQEDYRSENLSNPNSYVNSIALWPRAAIAWINTYNEFVRNAAKMNEYWFNLLCRPWTREQKNASSEKIRVE
jgi:hypothetical protein